MKTEKGKMPVFENPRSPGSVRAIGSGPDFGFLGIRENLLRFVMDARPIGNVGWSGRTGFLFWLGRGSARIQAKSIL